FDPPRLHQPSPLRRFAWQANCKRSREGGLPSNLEALAETDTSHHVVFPNDLSDYGHESVIRRPAKRTFVPRPSRLSQPGAPHAECHEGQDPARRGRARRLADVSLAAARRDDGL